MFKENYEKINLVELLKYCPKGMEFDCILFSDPVTYDGLNGNDYPIKILTQNNVSFYLTKEGYLYTMPNSKCIIFPKGKTTWEGFVPPCKFKDGDICYIKTEAFEYIFIFKNSKDDKRIQAYTGLSNYGFYANGNPVCEIKEVKEIRFTTNDEKTRLFNAIKNNGYHWNSETKTLEKLVKLEFKINDWVVFNNHPEKGSIYQVKDTHNYEYTLRHILGGSISVPFSKVDMFRRWTINDAKDGDVLFHSDSASNGIFIFKEIVQRGTSQKIICHCDYDSEDGFCLGENHTCCWTDSKILHPATKEQRDLLFQKIKEAGYKWNSETKTLEKLIKPIFKTGNKVRNKNNHNIVFTITSLEEDYYSAGASKALWFDDQDKYELVPDKFNITTLKPFDKVLVRDTDKRRWDIHFYEGYDNEDKTYPYRTLGGMKYKQCIPYEGNEHLIGLIKDCDDYYKSWINEENEFN